MIIPSILHLCFLELKSLAVWYLQVGAAQQWYDELDNLAFSLSAPESELNVVDDCTTSDIGFQDAKVHIDCAVNTSPGTSEVCTSTAYYHQFQFTFPPFYIVFGGWGRGFSPKRSRNVLRLNRHQKCSLLVVTC